MFPHDIIELIIVQLPVKSLLRFKSVSKKWRSTIESRHFQERQMVFSQSSRDPCIMLMHMYRTAQGNNGMTIETLSTSVFELSGPVHIPNPLEKLNFYVSPTSCDGLICFSNFHNWGIVVNPATRFHRSFPPPSLNQIIHDSYKKKGLFIQRSPGFGRDKVDGTYKVVLLVNSLDLGLKNVTTCEVFDFSTNTWRYITPSSPYRVIECIDPVCLDGSLYWFTDCKETKVVALDLYTETFQVIAEAPFGYATPNNIVLCNLDNRLCIFEMKYPEQVIWSFDSCNKIWEIMFSIDHERIRIWFGQCIIPLWPLAVLKRKKKKDALLLSSNGGPEHRVVVHDPETNSYALVFTSESLGSHVSYVETLVSL